MKRVFLGLLLLLALTPSMARAQATGEAADDVDAAQAEVDRDYAEALSSDCTLACRALESMRRATEKLCHLDPGDRCTKARGRVLDATAKVRAACPVCAESLEEKRSAEGARPTDAVAQPAAPQAESLQTAPPGGCRGCATATGPEDGLAPLVLLGLGVMVARRREGRERLRRAHGRKATGAGRDAS